MNYAKDPEVTRYVTWKPHENIEQTVEWIKYCIKTCNDASGIKLVIFHQKDRQAIGMIDFRFAGHSTNFGYVLAKSYWNQGIMTEAMRPAIAYVYSIPSIYRIWAVHHIENAASGKVMEKIGMTFECILRRYEIFPNISNTPEDAKLYSMVK